MPADLAALLAQRNARLRAWRACGVPVEGGWRPGDPQRDFARPRLTLRCGSCGGEPLTRGMGSRMPLATVLANLNDHERASVEEWLGRGCPHLAPLLGEDPPEVQALTTLELLAGDPPR
jgi:hypothetical protein